MLAFVRDSVRLTFCNDPSGKYYRNHRSNGQKNLYVFYYSLKINLNDTFFFDTVGDVSRNALKCILMLHFVAVLYAFTSSYPGILLSMNFAGLW